ncbi:MAG: hypothetical protein U0670_13085 [Anaerolineae bacterium]
MNATTFIHKQLELPDAAAITLTALHIDGWGRTLIFRGQLISTAFTLTFNDCREMRWRVYAHQEANVPTLLVEFAQGRDLHRSPAQLLTEHFGLSVFYGSLTVTRDAATPPA